MENDDTAPNPNPITAPAPDTETSAPGLGQQVTDLLQDAESFGAVFLQPGRQLYQLLMILGLVALAWGINWLTRDRIRAAMHGLRGWPKWRLRALVILHKRLPLIIFAGLAWALVAYLRATTWPSWSNVLTLAATVATAWLLVGFAARLIQNRFSRRLVSWGLWVYVTLHYLGLIEAASDVLESLAIENGDFRLSVLTVVKALVILAVLFTAVRLIAGTTKSRVVKNPDISPSMQVLIIKFMQMVLYGSALFLGLKAVGFDLTGLAFLSGAIGVGLGFGLQKVVSNLVSGIIILLDKSIKPGDVISLGDTFGWINALGARYVSVVTRNGKEFLIPNEDLITGQVVNWSHSNAFVRLDIFFGTAYDDDPHLVRKIACDAAASVDRILRQPKAPVCHIVGFGDSSVDYILRFWIDDPTGGLTNVRGAVYLALWDAFKANGISIPFPQREVRMLDETSPNAGPQAIAD